MDNTEAARQQARQDVNRGCAPQNLQGALHQQREAYDAEYRRREQEQQEALRKAQQGSK